MKGGGLAGQVDAIKLAISKALVIEAPDLRPMLKKAGFSIKYISEMENGRRNPSDKAKKKLAKPLGVKPVDIFLACQRTICSKNKEQNNKLVQKAKKAERLILWVL